MTAARTAPRPTPQPHKPHADHAPWLVRAPNRMVRWLLTKGAPMGPNVAMTVRGRTSGVPHTFPVAVSPIDGRHYVMGAYGDVNWTRNLRAAGEATVTIGRRHEEVVAEELDVASRATFFRDVVAPYVRRIRIGGVLLAILGAKEVVDDPVKAAETRPVFELRAA